MNAIRTVGIVGAGTMGRRIAFGCAASGIASAVRHYTGCRRARRRVGAGASRHLTARGLPNAISRARTLVTATESLAGCVDSPFTPRS